MSDNPDESPFAIDFLALKGGVPLPRERAVRAAGAQLQIAWWDMFAAPDAVVPSNRFLEPGLLTASEKAAIPEGAWAQHRKDFARPDGHGLKLEDEPAFVGVFRYPEDSPEGAIIGAIVGYRTAA